MAGHGRGVVAGLVSAALSCALGAMSCSPNASKLEVLKAPIVEGVDSATDPAIVNAPDGRSMVLAWVGGDSARWRLYAARSVDGGSTWSVPVPVSPPDEPIHPHGESSPRLIAASGGRIAAVWSTSQDVPGREWPASDVRFSRSLDGGQTWSVPVTLNDDSLRAPAGHSFQGATLVGDSGIVVAWLDERPVTVSTRADSESFDDASLFVVRSEDFGANWQPNRGLFTGVCPCCRVQLAAQADRVVSAWRKHYPGQLRDIVVASMDGPPTRVFADNWKIAGCPHSGPAIAFDGAGAGHIAWFSGAAGHTGVYYRRWTSNSPDSAPAPIAIQQGEQIPTSHVGLGVTSSGRAVVVYDLTPGGKRGVTVAEVDETGRLVDRSELPSSEGGTYPQLALPSGAATALVVWARPEAGGRQSLGLVRIRLTLRSRAS